MGYGYGEGRGRDTIRPNSLPRAHDQDGIVGETRDVFLVLRLGVAGLVEGGEEVEDWGCFWFTRG